MTFESKPTPGPTPEQVKVAEEMLKDSSLKGIGLADEGLTKKSTITHEVFGMDSTKKESQGDPWSIVGEKEAENAAKHLEGSDAEKWELI